MVFWNFLRLARVTHLVARVWLYCLPHSKGNEIHPSMKYFSSCPFLHCVSLIFFLLTGFNNLWFFTFAGFNGYSKLEIQSMKTPRQEIFRLHEPLGKPRSGLGLSLAMVVWCICCHCPCGCRVTIQSWIYVALFVLDYGMAMDALFIFFNLWKAMWQIL